MNGSDQMLTNMVIIFVVASILSLIARIILLRVCVDDRKFQKKVKEMYNHLDSFEKQKYKDEKRKTLLSAILVSISISIVFSIFWIYRNPTQFDVLEGYVVLLLNEIGIFAVFLILSYMILDNHNQKKWMKEYQAKDGKSLNPQ